jgi:hypothetical protein
VGISILSSSISCFSDKSSSTTKIELSSSYSLSETKQTIKAYQVSFIQDGYIISYIYKSPSLLYIQEKGYIDDMIDSAKFIKK